MRLHEWVVLWLRKLRRCAWRHSCQGNRSGRRAPQLLTLLLGPRRSISAAVRAEAGKRVDLVGCAATWALGGQLVPPHSFLVAVVLLPFHLLPLHVLVQIGNGMQLAGQRREQASWACWAWDAVYVSLHAKVMTASSSFLVSLSSSNDI